MEMTAAKDVDGFFGELTLFMRKRLHYAETIIDFRDSLQEFMASGTRPREKIREVIVLDQQRDWKNHLAFLRLQLHGHTGPRAPRVFEFRQRRGKRKIAG